MQQHMSQANQQQLMQSLEIFVSDNW